MRRDFVSVCALAVLVGLTSPAGGAPLAPPPVIIQWQVGGTVLATADLNGSPGLELVLGGLPSGRMEIVEPLGGTTAYQLPALYGDGGTASILVENFDGTGGGELMVWYRVTGTASRYGMFGWDGTKYQPRWEVSEPIPVEAVLGSVDFVGNGIRHVVALTPQAVRIFDALNGLELYDSSDETPQLHPLSMAAFDIDGDGTEELVVTGIDASVPTPVTVVLGKSQAVGTEPAVAPRATWLGQNAPNPFRGPTRIAFTVPRTGHVRMRIYDVTGRLVRGLVDERRSVGPHVVEWDGRDAGGRPAPSGSYFCELEVDGARQSRRMVRLD